MIGKKVPIDAKKARGRTKWSQIAALTDYIMAGYEAAGEKVLYAGARGFNASTRAGRQAEMVALAMESVRSANPVTHWVLSWREGELPNARQIEQAIDLFLHEQGLLDHQVMYALHQDTSNLHLHVVVNRVHPTNLRVVKANGGFDREATARAVARIEAAQGWVSEHRARYRMSDGVLMRVLDGGRAVPAGPSLVRAEAQKAQHMDARKALAKDLVGQPRSEQLAKRAALRATQVIERRALLGDVPRVPRDREKPPTLHTRARDMEQRTAESSAQRLAIRHAGAFLSVVRNWSTLHEGLAEVGMRYVLKGSGALIYVGDTPLKASQVDRAASLTQLEKRLGPYQPAAADVAVREIPSEPVHRSPDWSAYREARRRHEAARRVEAEALQQRLATERTEANARHRAHRTLLLNHDWRGLGVARSALSSVLAAEQARALAALKERHAADRMALRRRLPPFPPIEVWLRDSARPELAERWRHRNNPAPMLFGDRDDAPVARAQDIRDFIAEPGERCVVYRRRTSAVPAFVDHGRRIELQSDVDRDATLATLQLAAAKWGRVHVSGPAAFQQQVVELAAEHGFAVTNPELQERINAERSRRRQVAKQRERDVVWAPVGPEWERAQRALREGGRSHGISEPIERLLGQAQRWFPDLAKLFVRTGEDWPERMAQLMVEDVVRKVGAVPRPAPEDVEPEPPDPEPDDEPDYGPQF